MRDSFNCSLAIAVDLVSKEENGEAKRGEQKRSSDGERERITKDEVGRRQSLVVSFVCLRAISNEWNDNRKKRRLK